MTQTTEPDQVSAQPSQAPSKKSWHPRSWQRRTQLVTAGAALAAMAAGGGFAVGAASVDPMASAEYQNLKLTADSTETRLATVVDRNKALLDANGEVTRRETAVERREREVTTREQAVGKVEQAARDAQIAGSGTYIVGEDVKAGTYRSADNEGCYYAFMSSTAADARIRDNNYGDGQMRVTLRNGDVFESSGCNVWNPA